MSIIHLEVGLIRKSVNGWDANQISVYVVLKLLLKFALCLKQKLLLEYGFWYLSLTLSDVLLDPL